MSNYGFGTTGQVLTSNGAGTFPTFQPSAALTSFSAYFSADSGGPVTGNNTVFTLNPDVIAVSNNFTYDPSTGAITPLNTGTFLITATMNITGIDTTHNAGQWIIKGYPSLGQIAQQELNNIFVTADQNTSQGILFQLALNITASSSFIITFTAYGGNFTIGYVNSGSFSNQLTVLQIG